LPVYEAEAHISIRSGTGYQLLEGTVAAENAMAVDEKIAAPPSRRLRHFLDFIAQVI